MMASSSSSSGGPCEYDVFLSFRGEDTRKIFAGHLYRALEQKTIHTFIDSEELEKGNKISELLTCIEKSRLSIVVLSQNYASSTWCLKELVKILDTKKQMVLPVFYEVDPSDLRKIQGNYAKAFAEHGLKPDLDQKKLESWRSAVIRVAGLIGWDSRDYKDDGKLIDEIVANTHRKLIHTSSNEPNGLVGMDSHITEIMSRLCLQVNDVRIVGIWGMGGLGKTTIARAVFNEIAWQFEHSCFLYNVKEALVNRREVQMQEELLSRLLKERVQSVGLDRGRNMIMERLGRKKVLVVLDDVETVHQIEALLGKLHAFGEGSRVIVTTRNKQSLSGVDETYEPTCLRHDEAQELFMKYAFTKNQPNGDYDRLSRRAIVYSEGLPLALKVLGAFLDNKSVREWEAVLEKLKKIPHIEIQDVLRTSIDGLDDFDRDIFLDIACFFRKWNKDSVTEFLDSCGFVPHNGLRVLVDRALITVSNYGTIDMHDLLQDMGKEIVRQESIQEPGKRSRLWSYGDIYGVLTQNTATNAVEGLMLDLSNSEDDLSIDPGAIVRMTKLRLLIISHSFYIFEDDWGYEDDDEDDWGYEDDDEDDWGYEDGCKQLSRGDLESLSHELRFLIWHGCPLKSLPSTFIPKNLVRLDMRGSRIQKLWEEKKPLPNLKVIMLSHCRCLVNVPDFTEAINLRKLFLDGCSSLLEVHSSVFALQNLHFLNLKRCKQLKTLPTSIHMSSLQTLDLNGCSNLEKFPEIEDVMTELKWLYLDGTGIKELPSSINNLTGLVQLSLKGCTELKTLPTSIHMSSLRTLDLDGCSNLEKFPEISGIMKELLELRLDRTAIKGLPSSINNLTGLVQLSLKGCTELKTLPTSIHMSSLRTLDLDGCSNLEKFPEIEDVMTELKWLYLDGTGIKELPSSINNLTGLVQLSLKGCTELKTLPTSIHMSSLRTLDLDGCSNLEKFPEIEDVMTELKWLYLDGTGIKGLPSSIYLLEGLKQLSMQNCESLEFLPDSICNLANLTHLDLSGCFVLHNLPEKLGDLKSLMRLEVRWSGIKQFPWSISRLNEQLQRFSYDGCIDMVAHFSSWSSFFSSWSSLISYYSFSVLVHLDLSDCNLLEFSDAIAHLSSLKTFKLCRNNLECLPVTMNRLGCLTHLEVKACRRLKSIPELSSINYINADYCTALETVAAPKTRNFDFRFSNCFRLVQANLFTDIVETHFLDQDKHPQTPSWSMCLPGSEIPDWFNHQCGGSSITTQLPPNWFDKMFLGFAICAVSCFNEADPCYAPHVAALCYCTFKGNQGDHNFSFHLQDYGFLESVHLFMVYVPWSKFSLAEKGELVNERYYTEATFKIVVESTCNSRSERHCMTSYGLRFFHGNYMEVQSESMTQPTIHVEGLGAPFYPDRLEVRKSITQWEAESSESGEERGTYQTLELLLEPQTESKDEEEIMVVAEQGEACRAGLCCCLSLSGCPMSLRNRNKRTISDELGSHSGLVVPNTESEGEEERVEGGFNNGRGVIDWKRIARVTMQLLLLAGCSIALKQTTLVRMKGKKSS